MQAALTREAERQEGLGLFRYAEGDTVLAGEPSGEIERPAERVVRARPRDEAAVAHARSMKSLARGLARSHIVM